MKKTMFHLPGKTWIPVLISGIFITACHNNDTEPTYVGGTDSAAMSHGDAAAADQTHVAPLDTSNSRIIADVDSLSKTARDTAMISKTDKKGKKGKVSIVAADTKPNTAAMEMDQEGFYKNTEVLPAFPGGQKALERFFEDNIQYPETATENGVEGTVKLIFNVDENGKIYQPLPVGNKIGSGLEDEAIRVFNKMPKWTPGKIKGKNVKTRFTLPIRFQLD